MNLTKERFMGNTVWFFLVINLCEVPVLPCHALFTRTSLAFGAMLIPAALPGALTGR